MLQEVEAEAPEKQKELDCSHSVHFSSLLHVTVAEFQTSATDFNLNFLPALYFLMQFTF